MGWNEVSFHGFPDKEGEYLFTVNACPKPYVTIGYLHINEDHDGIHYDCDSCEIYCIIAWMPLPKPYKK